MAHIDRTHRAQDVACSAPGDLFGDPAISLAAHASAHRIVNDLQWLAYQRPDALRVIETTTQRLRSDLAAVVPPFAPPLRLTDLPPDPLQLVYPPRATRRRRMAQASASYDARIARMTPLQRRLVDMLLAVLDGRDQGA